MKFCARRWTVVAGVIVSFLTLTNTTQASSVEVDLLDTLSAPASSGPPYAVFGPGFEPGQSVAVSFTTPGNGFNDVWNITSIKTSLSSPFFPVTLDLGLMADDNGHPSGTFLASATITASFDPVTLASPDWSIDGGAKYWLVAIAHSDDPFAVIDAQWVGSQIQGTFAFTSGDAGTWMTQSGDLPGALITGFETPLPGALVLFASGLGGIGVFGVRGRKKAPPAGLMRST